MTKTSEKVAGAKSSVATKSELVKSVNAIESACTNEFFKDGRLKESFVFKAKFVNDESNYLRGPIEGFSFVVEPVDESAKDEFEKLLDRMGVEKLMVKGAMPLGREMYVSFDRNERRPCSVLDFDELVLKRQGGTDEEVEAIDKLMNRAEVREILKAFNESHPRKSAQSSASSEPRRGRRTSNLNGWF